MPGAPHTVDRALLRTDRSAELVKESGMRGIIQPDACSMGRRPGGPMVGKFVAALVIDGRTYKVYGCRNETQPDGEYESWDVCADGVSLTGCTDRIDPLY